MISDGNTASPRKKHNRRRQDTKIRNREATRVSRSIDETPPWIDWVLDHRASLSLRFTPLQWMVLRDTYWDPYDGDTRQQKRQALKRHTDKNTIREALHAAEETAFELYYYWRPAHKRNTERKMAVARGEDPPALSSDDRKILAKHRREKKGRLQGDPKHLDRDTAKEVETYGPSWQGPLYRGGTRGPVELPVYFTDDPGDDLDPGVQAAEDQNIFGVTPEDTKPEPEEGPDRLYDEPEE